MAFKSLGFNYFKIRYDIFYSFAYGYVSNFKLLELLPLCLSENGDTLLLANVVYDEAFIYNRRYNKLEKIGIANNILWSHAKDYVESLVSTH